jgi:hypothetical protein
MRHLPALMLAGCSSLRSPAPVAPSAPEYLYVWASSADTARRGAFIATFDLRAGSPTAGTIVNVTPAGSDSRSTHHTEHALQSDMLLFANDFGTGETFIYDMSGPGTPRVAATFRTAGPFGWPHSYARLPNGNRLATYQRQSSKFNTPPGGIAEIRPDGSIIRWASASTPDARDVEVTPYSIEVVPALDVAVSTTTSMIENTGVHLQLWRISDFKLLHTLRIPTTSHAKHAADTIPHHMLPGEPRLLADGKTVMVGTFMCGLYALTDIDKSQPKITEVFSFPGVDCAVPVVVGKYWIQTVPSLKAVVALDVSDPFQPREVSRVSAGENIEPHWLAADVSGRHLVMNAGSRRDPHVYLLTFDPATGLLGRNENIPRLTLDQVGVPGIGTVRGVPHGSVFSR